MDVMPPLARGRTKFFCEIAMRRWPKPLDAAVAERLVAAVSASEASSRSWSATFQKVIF